MTNQQQEALRIRVAVVDDHPILIRGLQNILGDIAFIELTGSYAEGKELLAGIAHSPPDVLLLDIQMPGQSGEELAHLLHASYPQIAIIAFTNQEQQYYINSMIKYGVKGYVLKSSGEATLLQAIESVYRGNTYFDPSIRERAVLALKPTKHNEAKNLVLTQREKEVLELLAANYNSKEIADKLFISRRTVDFHRVNLLVKLDVKNAVSLVKKAIEIGLIQ